MLSSNKYLRNATNHNNSQNNKQTISTKFSTTKPTNTNLSSLPSSSSTTASSSSSSSSSPPSPKAAAENRRMMGNFEFKPFKHQHQQQQQLQKASTSSRLSDRFSSSTSSGGGYSANALNSLLHTTHKNGVGKISKRKVEHKVNIGAKKLANFGLLQCFNLTEKEKFRQLISQNINQSSTKASTDSKNAYQKLIRSSPTKTRDDNLINEYRRLQQPVSTPKTEQIEKYSLANTQNKVSAFYTRRISLTPLPSAKTSTAAAARKIDLLPTLSLSQRSMRSPAPPLLPRKHDESIVDLLHDNDDDVEEYNDEQQGEFEKRMVVGKKKAAQKRRPEKAPIPEINLADSDDDDDDEIAKQHSDLTSKMSALNKVNRPLTEFEKKLNEKLNQNTVILEAILKSKTSSKALTIEEDRYKYKKRQRLEKERIERELASKFSDQLRIDTARLSHLYFREEEKIELIEDDFPELSDDQEVLIENALVAYPQDQVLVTGFGADITRKDIQTLQGLNWLNDEIINFYMNLVCERSRNELDQQQQQQSSTTIYRRCYSFSTFFYPKLVKEGYSQSLKRWTRKVDLFAHELVLVPVHLGLHWTLAIIDFTCREIRYYDSMNGFNHECLKLLNEHADKKGGAQLDLTKWSCFPVRDVPQQMNGSDCGMFTCKYAEYLSRGRTQFNFNQSHMPYFRRRMIWEILNKKLL